MLFYLFGPCHRSRRVAIGPTIDVFGSMRHVPAALTQQHAGNRYPGSYSAFKMCLLQRSLLMTSEFRHKPDDETFTSCHHNPYQSVGKLCPYTLQHSLEFKSISLYIPVSFRVTSTFHTSHKRLLLQPKELPRNGAGNAIYSDQYTSRNHHCQCRLISSIGWRRPQVASCLPPM
jgi:hypothetical protein